ncbi:LLM class flavin-dependent oxidoreductase [Sphingomonas aurantiaca]|uniref:LLM class flavin-dependent oxidoreductase n=1 Tax=Sphingomonas aurantiaca TaxID=185949 RepID=UPI002FE29702
MRYGYWTPVFGGWLRNVPDEGMEASWAYTKALTQNAERWGYDLTLIAELNLNDIKGVEQPALDAWSTAAALAAVTDSIELMVAVRPNFHHPALFAKAAANIDRISGGRLALNVVSSWWADEAKQYGLQFDQHDDRYARTAEWLTVVDGLWTQERFDFAGQFYTTEQAICSPKPVKRPTVYAGGESEKAKAMIAAQCDAYVMHGDPADAIAPKIADMAARRAAANEKGGRRTDAIRHGRLCDRPRQRGGGEARARAHHQRHRTARGLCEFRPVAVGHAARTRTEDPGIFGLQPRPAPQSGRNARTVEGTRGGV